MSRFDVLNESNAPQASLATFEAVKENYGFLPNLMGILGASPAAVEAYATLSGIFGKTDLTPVEQQVVLQTVNFENNCTYCVAAHSGISQRVGMADDVLEALRNGTTLPDAKLEALSAFTRIVVRERGYASDDQIDAFLAAGYTKGNVLDVVLGVSLKTLSNYTNHIAETPLDGVFQGFAWTRPELASAE